MTLKLDGTGAITGVDQGLNVVGVGTLHNELSDLNVVVGGEFKCYWCFNL